MGFPLFIGITGKSYSGKTTTAGIIADLLKKYKVVRTIPFAYALKEQAKQLGWNGKKDEKGRKLLQMLGTEVGRELIDPHLWVNKWIEVLAEYQKFVELATLPNLITVADDVRFNNEAKVIRQMKGIIIKIIRPEDPDQKTDHHLSERGIDLDLVDYEIMNDGDLDKLRKKVDDVLTEEIRKNGI